MRGRAAREASTSGRFEQPSHLLHREVPRNRLLASRGGHQQSGVVLDDSFAPQAGQERADGGSIPGGTGPRLARPEQLGQEPQIDGRVM